jgi:hypothetical protein
MDALFAADVEDSIWEAEMVADFELDSTCEEEDAT